ncbi:MAG: hypothetical protein K2P04_08950, partial [Oscillospiraceae bacterium]|nr:hypothetical protein [Oscillospiraceae bacterium]
MLDRFLDPMRYRDHICTNAEAAEFKVELQLAVRLGFPSSRIRTPVPPEVLERCLSPCDWLNVR